MQLDISDPEYELLVEILPGYQGDLRTEIQHTDNPVYKKQLKEEEDLLGSVLSKLRALKSSAA
jgi:hypothetical protein